MALALALGRRGLGNTWPNPAVGAVIVKDGVIVGRGWTQPGGRPHAEVEALRRAKKAAQGATMYVTLEPCSHQGKTPPCADAIIKAGIARVVSALEDPNPEVAGKGHARLRDKGIAVEIGLGADEARRVHAGHIMRVTQRPPLCDAQARGVGRRQGGAGRPQAGGDHRRGGAGARVPDARASDAILVGIGTVLPTIRSSPAGCRACTSARRCAWCSTPQLRLPLTTSVVATVRDTPTWVFTSRKPSAIAEEILQQKGCKVFRVGDADGQLDLAEVLQGSGRAGHHPADGGGRADASPARLPLPAWSTKLALLRGAKTIGADGIDAAGRRAADRRLQHRAHTARAWHGETARARDTLEID